MIDIKADFSGGLNLDDAVYNVPKSSYIDAVNVTTDAIAGANDKAITNIVGNQLVEYDFPTVSLFSSVSSFTTINTYTALVLTGTVIPNTNIIVYLKKQNNQVIVIGNYTTILGDTIDSIYNALVDSISANIGAEVISVDVAGDQTLLYLRIEHISTSSISNDNIQISSFNQGENVCIGALPNNVTNTVIYFVWNSLGFHTVLEYENTNRTIFPIFINLTDSNNVDVLNFDRNKKITSINIYNRDENAEDGGGDLLFFIDSVGRPTTMDIKRFKNGEYTPVERYILDVCKRPPLFPPLNVYVNDTDVNTNNLRNRLFRFKYRYIYDNNERSVCSPIGSLPLPVNIIDDEFNNDPNNNNRIDLVLNTGDKDVKSIELLMSFVRGTNDWSDFAIVENIKKSNLFLTSKSTSTEDNPGDTAIKANVKFSGVLIPGTVVNMSIKEITAGGIYQIATYIIQDGDGMAELTAGLVSSLLLSGFVTSPTDPTPNSIEFYYDGALYIFNNDFISIILPQDANVNNIPFSYSFYNDGTYPVIDVAESIQLFDYVPELANAQEMANGNVLIYGGITEGYDRDIVPNVVNTIFSKVPQGEQVDSLMGSAGEFFVPPYTKVAFTLTFWNIPVPETEINIYINDNGAPDVLAATYTTQNGDGLQDVINKLYLSFIAIGKVESTVKLPSPPYQMNVFLRSGDTMNGNNTLEIIAPTYTNNSVPTFLFSTKRRIGIAYFDRNGKTNGILYSGGLEFPEYKENDDNEILLPYISTQIFHTPPDWAYSYGFYLSKEATQFLYWKSTAVKLYGDYLYFDITNLGEYAKLYPTTSQVLSYTFQDGDRLRLIRDESDDTVFTDKYDIAIEGQIVNPTGVTPAGTYIKVKNIFPFAGLVDGSYIIQLYRPVQQLPSGENTVYYEFGQQYGIGNPGAATRYHMGMIQDQGTLPINPISVNAATQTFPSGSSITRYTVFGTPVTNTIIDIKITDQNISNQITLASYIVKSTDTIQSITTSLYNILQASPYNNILFGNLYSPQADKFEFTYSSVFLVESTDTVVTYPAVSELPAKFEFYNGDVYYRLRRIGATLTRTIDRNFVDNYISAVNSIEGRPSVIDVNARRAYYSTMVRFGQSYQPNTNINGLNRFFPANFDEYDYSYGDIMRLKVRDRFIRVFQKLKVGKVPLYSQIVKDPASVQNLIVSDKLINPIAYYVGDLGIGEHAESLASYNYADYFTSNIKGIIARVGEEGVTFLSIDHKVDSWAAIKLPLRTGNYKVYGGLDQILGNYIIALEPAPGDNEAYTLVYDVNAKIFSTFFSYHPEMMVTLATVFISFKDGQLYTHDDDFNYNTFFGQPAADSSITLAFNQNPLDKKTFMSVGEVASQIWDVPVIQTDINSYGTTKMESNLVDDDFVELEGTYEAAILRDKNSIGGVLEGDSMKGKYMTMKFRAKTPTSLVSLNLLSLKSINSPLNNRW
jgi:hypothetical protein